MTRFYRAAARLGAGLALLPLTFSAARAQTVTLTIDTFSDEQLVLVSGGPTGFKSATSIQTGTPGNILGLERDLTVARTSNNRGIVTSDVSDSFTGVLSLGTSIGTTGYTQIDYDGADNSLVFNPTGLGGADFTINGGDSILFTADSDLGGGVTITVYTDAVNYSTFTTSIAGTGSGLNFSNYLAPFTSFVPTGGTGANFASIGAVKLFVAANLPESDIALDFFGVADTTVVPEPGVVLFAGVAGLMMCGLVARRRFRRAA